jgi:hypothetical protein
MRRSLNASRGVTPHDPGAKRSGRGRGGRMAMTGALNSAMHAPQRPKHNPQDCQAQGGGGKRNKRGPIARAFLLFHPIGVASSMTTSIMAVGAMLERGRKLGAAAATRTFRNRRTFAQL